MFARFGGKRAIAMRMLRSGLLPFGASAYLAPTTSIASRLVFVCSGNICRSPFAEHVARQQGFESFSMGLHASEGSPPNPAAVAAAFRRGVDMSSHKATPFRVDLIRNGDLLLAFEQSHAHSIAGALAGMDIDVRLLGYFLGLTHHHIHDPYGLGDAYFDNCFETIHRSVEHVLVREFDHNHDRRI